MFKDILLEIPKFDTIILHRHSRPDGDALGSQVGLKHLLLENFPGKTVYTVGDEAGFFSFFEYKKTAFPYFLLENRERRCAFGWVLGIFIQNSSKG
jgi:nanoRNase/pAp phosphatase (c-di-AMP/oligoRNAs hydrolase)